MTKEEYISKVQGCWLGKNIGGTLGMPMEWERKKNSVTYYTHDITGEPLPNDDLDIQILWLIALEDNGIRIDSKILGAYFNEFMIFTHGEYGTAKANLRAGLMPPISGSFNNSFKDSCGSYIRADLWACIFSGNPEMAAKYAFEDAIVDHGNGEGVYGEVFFAAMESTAFVIKDIRSLIKIGLSYIPNDCDLYKCIEDAIRTYDEGMSMDETREYIMQNYIGHLEWHAISDEDREKGYNEGKMGWDVPSNIMIIIYGLLFGENDYEKSMCLAVNYGEDTDCTAGTIAALFGIIGGKDIFAPKWTEPIGNRIVTISIDPFRMSGRIPATLEEMTERVVRIHDNSIKELELLDICSEWTCNHSVEEFLAKDYFMNIYDEMNVVRFFFGNLNVRLSYEGAPVIIANENKTIKFILSNTSRAVTSDRLSVYLYSREGCEVLPQGEQSVFLTMAHMGEGIKEISYEIAAQTPLRPIYHFVAEFIYEDSKNNTPMLVPFVLLTESGKTLPVKWENNGPKWTPNMPRI